MKRKLLIRTFLMAFASLLLIKSTPVYAVEVTETITERCKQAVFIPPTYQREYNPDPNGIVLTRPTPNEYTGWVGIRYRSSVVSWFCFAGDGLWAYNHSRCSEQQSAIAVRLGPKRLLQIQCIR